MNTGQNAEPGARPRVGDDPSDKATISLLRQNLSQAEHNVRLWKEQAWEAREESIQHQSKVTVLQEELDSNRQELALLRDQYRQQGELVSAQREEIESKNKLLRDCQKALTQVTVLIDWNLADTERKDRLTKKEAGDLKTRSQERIMENSIRNVQSIATTTPARSDLTRGERKSRNPFECREREDEKLTAQSPISSKDSIRNVQSVATTTPARSDLNRGERKSRNPFEWREREDEDLPEYKGQKRSNEDKPLPAPQQNINDRPPAKSVSQFQEYVNETRAESPSGATQPTARVAAKYDSSTLSHETLEHRPAIIPTMDGSSQSGSARDFQSTTITSLTKDFNRGDLKVGSPRTSKATKTTASSTKDYNRGELRPGGLVEGGERERQQLDEDKGKKRSNKDKPFPKRPQETNDRSSASARDRSRSPVKRKSAPPNLSVSRSQRHLDLREIGMVARPGNRATLPPPHPLLTSLKELNIEEELAAARAIEAAHRSDKERLESLDHAMARQLDRELNSRGRSF